ncbi:MAG TPA: alpha/beta hydrolase-fold protein, partial [Verrucomicrobium sp.]|nr:alpha/beta hydrolase-fold protein [Verrucomicrobium sp.]
PLSEKQPYTLARTEERFITSTAGKEYRIMISWPEGRAPDSGFPITYVLDGDDIFPMATATLRVQAGTEKLSQHNAISPGLIVGIGYRGKSGRSVDYIPNVPKQGPPETYVDGRPYPEQPVGDAETFLDFLLKELRPAIEKDYAVDRTRQSLLGNGYGGLFALHVLFTRPESFQTYVASSPSVWWNNKYILQEEAEFAKRVQSQPVQATLVMSAGELEQTLTQHEYSWPDGPREEHASKTARRRMVDNTREMSWRLIKLESKGLKSSYRVFPGESHKSVIPVAVASALPLVFPSLPGSGPVDDKESGKEKAKTAEAGSSLPDTVKAK